MRRILSLLSVAVLAALAGRGEAAPSHASPVNSGDRVFGTIDSASDRDLFRIEVPEGATLQVVAKASKKFALLPDLGLLDPSGNPVNLKQYISGQTTSTVSIPVFGIHDSGTWTVAVSGYGGTTGDYQFMVKVVTVPKIRTTLTLPAGATIQQHFVAVHGARVDYSTKDMSGPGLARAGLLCPCDDPLAGTEAVRAGPRMVGKNKVIDHDEEGDHEEGGLFGLEMTNSSYGPTTVDVTIAIRFPKVKTKKVSLGAEPRPSAMAPSVGCNGTPFVLTGTEFQAGARVVFGDSDEAVDVQVISPTEIHGKAPVCNFSREGGPAEVSVLNPDGQFGTAPSWFTFIGIPAPTGIHPALSPLEGGVSVLVAGTRFRPGCAVEVDGIPSAEVTYLSPNSISFLTPPAAAGSHSVVVIDEYDRPSTTIYGLWYSDTPTVASASPSKVSSLGGQTITLLGTGFVPGVRVFVGGNEAVIGSLVAPTALSFACPAAKSGPVEVRVLDPLGRFFEGDLLTMTPSLHDETSSAAPAAPMGADFYGDSVTLGDTTGDGMPEILITSRAPWSNPVTLQSMPGSWLLRNDGNGIFSDRTSSLLPDFSSPGDDGQGDAALMGDLDGDGACDALLVRAAPLPAQDPFTSYYGYRAYYDVSYPTFIDAQTREATRFLRNDGTGSLSDLTDSMAPVRESTPAFGKGERWQGKAAALGDLDGDGDRDLVLVSRDQVGTGTISGVSWVYRYGGYYGTYKYRDKALLAQDWNASGAVRVLDNEGGGAFFHDAYYDPAPVTGQNGIVLDDFHGVAAALGDLNGDGSLDLVVLGADHALGDDGNGGVKETAALRMLFNDGDGAFAFAPNSIPAPLAATIPASEDWWQGCTVALADFDGDGDLDIVVGRESVRTWEDATTREKHVVPALRFFRNQGGTTFTEDTAGFLAADLTTNPTTKTLLGVKSMCATDLDGDGDTDLVVTGRNTQPTDRDIPSAARMATRILLNDGGSGLVDATADWLAAGDFLPADGLAVGDLDGDGATDLVLVLNEDTGSGKRSLRVLLSR